MAVLETAGDVGLSAAGFTGGDTVATVTDSGTLALWRADGTGEAKTVELRDAASQSGGSDPAQGVNQRRRTLGGRLE